jgi:hypothetical protein
MVFEYFRSMCTCIHCISDKKYFNFKFIQNFSVIINGMIFEMTNWVTIISDSSV